MRPLPIALAALLASAHGLAAATIPATRLVHPQGIAQPGCPGPGETPDPGTAVALCLAAARQGNADAQLDVGYMYEMGEWLARDLPQAAHWYRKSAEQGNAIAQKNLGQFYEDGTAVAQDEAIALSWYRKSAEQGYRVGLMKVGYFLESGKSVKKDPAEAHGWYLKAAELDDVTAQYNLAQQYRLGRGVAADPAEAVKWYMRAAKNGDVDAMTHLGSAWQKGEGAAKDLSEAARWYTAAADGGDALGALRLGIMYFDGNGVARDYVTAYKRFEQAGAAGEETGYFWLGVIHERGLGRARDDTLARAMYTRAETLWEANIRRAVMSAHGRGGPHDSSYFQKTLDGWARDGEIEQLEKLAQAFAASSDGARAQQVYERLLQVAERQGKAESVRLFLEALANSYANFEMPLKAEPHYLRLLASTEKAQGPKHPDVAETLEDLASVYMATARLALAEVAQRRALEIRLATQGQASQRTRRNLRKLAVVVGSRGDLPGARQYLSQSQSYAERDLGPADDAFPGELVSIAQNYYDLGQYADAEILYRRALALAELRADAEAAQDSPLNGLAWTLGARGAHAESEHLFRRIVGLREKRHGKDHYLYAAALGGLGLQLSRLDRHAEAEQALQQALALRQVYLGKFDGEVALALNQAGMGWARQGKLAEAEEAFKNALALRERVYTPVHVEIAASLNELGALYLSRQQFDKAEPLLRRALSIRKQLMPLHPDTRANEALVHELAQKTSSL